MNLRWLERCGSTNDALWRLAPEGVTAVGADLQTEGRGRAGRAWISPPGAGLYLSWLAEPRFPMSLGGALPLLAAVALAEQCAEWGVTPTLKWPNDLLLGSKKLAGVLCEARMQGARWSAAVGIGLNLRTPAAGYPAEIPAVALDQIMSTPPSPRAAAEALLPRLEDGLAQVAAEGLAPMLKRWQAWAPPIGTQMAQAQVVGGYAGLAPDGALQLQTPDGLRLIHAGDVELVAYTQRGD